MPDAEAADKTSRLRAVMRQYDPMKCKHIRRTLITVDAFERLHEEIGTAASDMNKRTLLAEPQTRSYCQTLEEMSIVI
jgi:hypothetical protein